MDGRWIIDNKGRVGCEAHGRITYAYGEQRAPLSNQVLQELTEDQGRLRFEEQRRQMWTVAMRHDRLAHAILSSLGVRRDQMLHDELYTDIGVPTLCRAAVMHQESRGLIEAYCRRLLRNAYRRALRQRREFQALGEADVESAGRSAHAGLSAREELSNLNLSEYELELLLARYDSMESLEDIARSLGLSSRSTPLHHLTKILDRCRRTKQ